MFSINRTCRNPRLGLIWRPMHYDPPPRNDADIPRERPSEEPFEKFEETELSDEIEGVDETPHPPAPSRTIRHRGKSAYREYTQEDQPNTLGVVSLVSGIIGAIMLPLMFCFGPAICGSGIFGLVGVVTGYLGLREYKEGRAGQYGIAMAGLIVNLVIMLLLILFFAGLVLLFLLAVLISNSTAGPSSGGPTFMLEIVMVVTEICGKG